MSFEGAAAAPSTKLFSNFLLLILVSSMNAQLHAGSFIPLPRGEKTFCFSDETDSERRCGSRTEVRGLTWADYSSRKFTIKRLTARTFTKLYSQTKHHTVDWLTVGLKLKVALQVSSEWVCIYRPVWIAEQLENHFAEGKHSIKSLILA